MKTRNVNSIAVAREVKALLSAIAHPPSRRMAVSALAGVLSLTLATVAAGANKGAPQATPELQAAHGAASAAAAEEQIKQQTAEPSKDKPAKAKRERFPNSKPQKTQLNERVQENVIVVKFKEGTHVRYRQGKLVAEKEKRSAAEAEKLRKHDLDDATVASHLEKAQGLLKNHPNHSVAKLFSREEADLDRDRVEAEAGADEEVADLNLYFHIYLEAGQAEKSAALIDELNALGSIEIAYAEPKSEPAAADIAPTTSLMTDYQGYLSPGPGGVDAGWAWSYYGGRGDNVRVIDIEGGWDLYHEDLNWPFHISGVFSTDPGWVNHGTAVLGVIAAAENAYGVTGISPRASVGVSSVFRYNNTGAVIYDFADAVNRAAAALTAGDIILIEQHGPGPQSGLACTCNCGQFEFVPMEYWQANYDAIRNATARGIIVLEAAGNGSMNLDSAIYGGVFNRNVRDSGAIMIGAGTANGRVPECWSNHGSRVDVEGWGDSVATLGYGDLLMANGGDTHQWYTRWFSGTSSATPIATGAAAAVQGMRKARGMLALNSYQMRRLLSETGTAQATDSRNIGPLPNLRNAFDAHGSYSYISPGSGYTWDFGTVAPQGFQDYFFYSAGGHYYEFSTCYWASFDTVIDVYNPHGKRIASNDDSCGLQSYVAPWASVAGWYRVRVRGYGSYSTGSYWMYCRMF